MKPVTIIVNGNRMVGNLCTAHQPAKLAFLFLHGWLGHENTAAAQALASSGYTSLTYTMRGNGNSDGDIAKLTKVDFLNDAAAAYDYLREQVGDDCRIGVVGSSFGCYIGLLLTELRAVHCLALRVPANYPDNTFSIPEPASLTARKGLYDAWRRKPLEPAQNKALHALHAFNGQVLIIEAERDEQVPAQTPKNYAKAIKDPNKLRYEIMKNAPHSLTSLELQQAYGQILKNWVQQRLTT